MPRPRPPGTLQEQCVRSVARNMDELWCRDYVTNWMGNSGSFMYVLGPFENLPSVLIEKILEELIKTRKLRKHHLHLLLVYHLETLILKESHDVAAILPMLVSRCKKIRRLGLKSRNLPIKAMNDLFLSLELLTVVDLSWTNTSDQTLSVIGAYSKHIRVLNLTSANITDIGIKSLCTNERSFNQAEAPTVISQTLVKLNIYATVVTAEGVQCALLNMPNLVELMHSALLYALALLEQDRLAMVEEGDTDTPMPELRINNIYSDSFGSKGAQYVDAKHVPAALRMASKATDVQLRDMKNVVENSFFPLTTVDKIVDLAIVLSENEYCDFATQVVPALQQHGSTIRSIHFIEVSNVDLMTIGYLCPEIQTLKVECCEYANFVPILTKDKKPVPLPTFSHLKEATLGNWFLETRLAEQTMPAEWLKQIFLAPQLKKLTICGQYNLTDELIIECVHACNVPNLEYCNFYMCNALTVEFVWCMLKCRNKLSTIEISQCDNIIDHQLNKCRRYIKRNKLDVTAIACQ